MLLKHGADQSARTDNNSTLLHAAAANGMDKVLHMLLEHGVNIGVDDEGRTW